MSQRLRDAMEKQNYYSLHALLNLADIVRLILRCIFLPRMAVLKKSAHVPSVQNALFLS